MESYIGKYVAVRRSYDTSGGIVASSLAVYWDPAINALRFDEAQDNRSASGQADREGSQPRSASIFDASIAYRRS